MVCPSSSTTNASPRDSRSATAAQTAPAPVKTRARRPICSRAGWSVMPTPRRSRTQTRTPPAVRITPGRRRQNPRVFVIRRIVAVLAVAAAIALVWFLVMLFQPFGSSGHGRLAVTIPRGASVSQIGSILERDGVISSAFFFKLRAAIDDDRGKLRAGYYELKKGMSYSAALDLLTTETGLPPTLNLTVIPGRSRRQVQAQLAAADVKCNYVPATV